MRFGFITYNRLCFVWFECGPRYCADFKNAKFVNSRKCLCCLETSSCLNIN